MKYYLLQDDMWLDESSKKWIFDHFKYATDKIIREFVNPPAEYMEPCTYPIDLFRDGVETDFSFTMDHGNIPILSEKAKDALAGLPEIEKPCRHVVIEPIRIDNKNVRGNYYVMIIETQIDCVDEEISQFKKYEVNDSAKQGRSSEFGTFFHLLVGTSKIGVHHIFRLKKHIRSIIASEEVKRRFEEAGVTGAVFEPVNGELNLFMKSMANYDPQTAMEYFARAEKRSGDGDLDGALRDYTKAILLEPNIPDEAIRLKLDFAIAWNNRGSAWARKGVHDEAINDYSEAILRKSNFSLAWNNRGAAWLEKGEYDQAISDIDRAIHLNPANKDYRRNRERALSLQFKKKFP